MWASETPTHRIKSMKDLGNQLALVIGLISDVTEQANLLALNTIIEAKFAGE